MEFRVYTPSGEHEDYSGSADYEISHPGHGLLATTRDDGTKVVYGPAGWLRLEEHGHRPGRREGGSVRRG
jgi:hypothetical protein